GVQGVCAGFGTRSPELFGGELHDVDRHRIAYAVACLDEIPVVAFEDPGDRADAIAQVAGQSGVCGGGHVGDPDLLSHIELGVCDVAARAVTATQVVDDL